MPGVWSRLNRGETTINFYGRRRIGFVVSTVLLVVAVVSLFGRGLNLGIDFKGGVAWEAPVTKTLDLAGSKKVLSDSGIGERDAKFQILNSNGTERIRIQAGAQTGTVTSDVQKKLAAAAKVDAQEVSVATVSSTWGRSITMKALRALLVFIAFVSLFIAWRFEWRMALSAIIAVIHDVGISVGVYSVLGLEVTPATVVAFLTILGFSLYDTIVVFDKVHDNTERFAASRASYGDIINVSMNQVLMRSLNTTLAAVLPVLSLLILGAGVMGAVALEEFALALFVGLATGAYSSIYIASPLLGVLKNREQKYAPYRNDLALGESMAHLMVTGTPSGRKGAAVTRVSEATERPEVAAVAAQVVLNHPPRPRKKGGR